MIELGQLEKHHAEFAKRNTQVIVASVEGPAEARQTQADFPHLLVLADESQGLSRPAALLHPHAGLNGEDVDAPTTILVDRHGTVRWLYRPPEVVSRLSPQEVLQAVGEHLPASPAAAP